MKKLLFVFMALIISIFANAQTETYFIDWSFGSNPSATGDANSNRTIEVGDTVTWLWYANGTHNVVSKADATESFSSPLQGSGSTFSHTFTQIGVNDYICQPHAGSMFGTITVVADGSLNTQDFSLLENLKIFPNPARDKFNLEFGINNFESLNVNIYNLIGQKVKQFNKVQNNDMTFDISNLDAGLYLLKIYKGNNSITKRLIID
ncbi:T9SS type A sorting domain-containing protein [Mesohalobacter halotolerans]|uniref:T9SS type A sorting domain-containing protein n=1 Tax=Mesohalobacter halotolerans TaxID=1883405 RepID=A0A4U5TU72_9FLAO|nr:T9SS type A sorting domain-containing protein [Mesohalobacter halotolerans]MBS3737462.1 T9SS type A sorting domain-containing protein [Psychroflexus sp.]TKS57044.1 T9SS type A sorting domain-containing protein [Mesohalobacter halotolerans]